MRKEITLQEFINQANHLQSIGRYGEAAELVRSVIGQYPDNPYLLYIYGTNLMYQGDFNLSMVLLHQAITNDPGFSQAYNNLAVCYRRVMNIEKSREYSLKAIELKDDYPDPYNNMASTYVNEGCPADGIEYANKAIELNEGNELNLAKSRWNKALMLLELGEFKEGFELYESGLDCGERPTRNYSEHEQTPYLKNIDDIGEGKTVVVYGEQGIGDEIMFAACLQNIIDTGATVILDCHPRLTTLFSRSFPGLEIHGTRKRSEVTWPLDRQIDYCVSFASLPRLYLQGHDAFTRREYIKPEEKIVRQIRDGLYDGRPIIGVAWTGGTLKTNEHYRTIPHDLISLITSNKDYRFVSLQYEKGGEIPDNVETMWAITQNYNYDLTACLVGACDAVVAINTSVIHLAGAMGKRVFCLTPGKPAWRYGISGESMIWYPDVHQYRQGGDDWKRAIMNLALDMNTWSSLYYGMSRAV